MGQGASQPERQVESSRPSRRPSVFRRSVHALSSNDEGQQDGLLSGQHSASRTAPRLRNRPGSVHRLSQLLNFDSSTNLPGDGGADTNERSRGSTMLERARSTFRDMRSRREQHQTIHTRSRDASRPMPAFLQHRTSYVRAGMNSEGADYYPPRLPSIDLTSSFENEAFASSQDAEPPLPRSSSSNRRPNLRFSSLRPDRPFRHLGSLRRRRQSPPPVRRLGSAEDQATLLSRLLSVAAAATAATLMGDDHHALSEARSLTAGTGMGDIGAGEDGSFDGFLRALQNGRIASALRGGNDTESEANGASQQGPLNFFRMFRFGASATAQESSQEDASTQSQNNLEGRMVPIIIVGIRSISPSSGNSATGSAAEDLPPFIDALGSFPSPLPTNALDTHGHDSIDSILRPPQNGTSFRHRRRASMGNFGINRNRLSDRMDEQRDHRSPERRRERPWSLASSSSAALEPRPPPATPASPSPELSRISSRNTTPGHSRPASFVASSTRETDSRRNSTLLNHRASPLSAHTEETVSLHSTHSSTNLLSQSQEADSLPPGRHRRSDTAPNIHYPRFASGHPRRNGMVGEPPVENLPPLSRTSTSNGTDGSRRNSNTPSSGDSRSWIIYVLGGSYPENHPILTTPSLFTENPTYEDMMLLSALLGPAKAPVATEEDVESAGGLYTISAPELSEDAAKTAALLAVAVEDAEERVPLEAGQRCLVCLCDFEINETARKLNTCQHLFHKECIDQWLTQGRNSCPLCRSQGVDEKPKDETSAADSGDDAADSDVVEGAASDTSAGAREPVEVEVGQGS